MFKHGQRLDGERRAANLTRLFDSAGDDSLFGATLPIALGGSGRIQVAKAFEHAERTDGHRSTSVEGHEMEEALLAGRQFVLTPHRVAELIARSRNLMRVHLTDIEFRIEPGWLEACAVQGWIAGPPDPRKAGRRKPTADRVHLRTRAEPNKEPAHSRIGELLGQTRQAVGAQSGLGATQVDAVPIPRRIGPLAVRIDGHIAATKGSAGVAMLNETRRLTVSVDPHRQPPHLRREGQTVHWRIDPSLLLSEQPAGPTGDIKP